MKAVGIGVLVVLGLLLVAAEDKLLPSVFIGDGSNTTAVKVIESVAALTEDVPGKLEFVCKNGETRFVIIQSAKQSLACFIQIDAMTVQVAVGGYLVNDERLDLPAAIQKIRAYNESAKSTDSKPSIFLNASEGVSGDRLVELLESMVGMRERWVIEVHQPIDGTTCTLPDYRFSESRAKTSPIRRQAERQPYKIDLEN